MSAGQLAELLAAFIVAFGVGVLVGMWLRRHIDRNR